MVASHLLRQLQDEPAAPTLRASAVREVMALQAAHGNDHVQRLAVQREDAPGGKPSLLDEGSQLTLDPALAAQMQALQFLDATLDPAAVRLNLLELPSSLIATEGAAANVSGPPTREKPLVPAGRGPAKTRRAEPGDILDAAMKVPSVDSALKRLQSLARERVSRDYQRLSRGEKVATVSTLAIIGTGAIAGLGSDPDVRKFAIGQLNGRVLPVPGLDGLGVEINTQGDNLMIGLHLDIGRVLPASLGFGASSAEPIGAPPAMRSLAADAGPRASRSPAPATAANKTHIHRAPTQTAGAVWKLPFNMEPAATRDDARDGALALFHGLNNLASALRKTGDEDSAKLLDDLADEAKSWFETMTGRPQEPLTADDVASLTEFSKATEVGYNSKIDVVKSRSRSALAPMTNARIPDTSKIEDQLAEAMHFAFLEGSTDQIGAIQEALSTINGYKGKVDDVLKWADRTASVLQNAKLLSHVESAVGGVEKVGGVLDKVNNVLGAAKAFATITGLDNQAAGPTQNLIGKFQAGLEGIDMSLGFFKTMPLLGQLWSNFYMPMTQECLRLVGVIAKLSDTRDRQESLYFFWKQTQKAKRPRGMAPTIPKEYTHAFPGGQPVLDYVYGVMWDRIVTPTPAVEAYFLKNRKLFSAAGEDLKTTGGIKTPLVQTGDEKLKDLLGWTKRNRDKVWAMLYGDLDPKLQ